MWISNFGALKRFLRDRIRGVWEFNHEGYQQMNENLNIEPCMTAAESPFSHRIWKHYNLIVAEAIENTLEDEKSEQEAVLAWAVSATNALQNHSGYSPNELIFGFTIYKL